MAWIPVFSSELLTVVLSAFICAKMWVLHIFSILDLNPSSSSIFGKSQYPDL